MKFNSIFQFLKIETYTIEGDPHTQRGFTPDSRIRHKLHPYNCFQRDPLLSGQEKLKWMLSDTGRKTAVTDLADVLF